MQSSTHSPVANNSPVLVLTSNTAWNLAHFRAPLLQAFVKRGFLLVALVPVDASVLRLQAMGCKVEPIPVPSHGRNPWDDFLLFWNYLLLLRRHRPVALLSFTVKPNIYAGLAARLLGITQLCNISGLGTAFIQGGWLGRLVQGLYRLGLGGAKTVFFQNPDDRDFFLARRLVREGQAALLPGSGVNLEHFKPDELTSDLSPWVNYVQVKNPDAEDQPIGQLQATKALDVQPPRPFVFLFIGRLLGDKGLLELVQAVKLLAVKQAEWGQADQRGATLLPRLLILGPDGGTNPTAIAPSILAQWRQDSQLELLGPADDVRPYIRRADCVVLPSYREGTPRSLLEAAAMGKPLIATDVPGCRQVVQDGRNGYLCQAKDSFDLARVMRQLMRLPFEKRQAMGRASRKLAEDVFDENRVVQHYLDALFR